MSVRNSGLPESRITPTAVPRMVASTIPAVATRSVLTPAATIAQAKLSVGSNATTLSPMRIPAGRSRKPNPADRFSRARLSTSVVVSSAATSTSTSAPAACAAAACVR